MIKSVVFDYGGVISSGGGGIEIAERFALLLNIPTIKAQKLIHKPWGQFVAGKISEENYWHDIELAYGHPIPAEHRQIWNNWEHMSPRPEMIAFIKSLKARSYTVGLMSNVIPFTREILQSHNVYDLFDPCLLSCDFGYAKPDVEIYQELLRLLSDNKPSEIVFVDDQQRCLDPAQALGIHTVLAQTSQQIISTVESLIRT